MGASSRDFSDVNELVEFWINGDQLKHPFEKNENDNDKLRDSYCNGDANQIPTKAPRLEKISSVSLAIELWNQATSLFPEIDPDSDARRRSLFSQAPEWVSQLNLPRQMASDVVDHFIDIVLQVRDWINYHLDELYWIWDEEDRYYRRSYRRWGWGYGENYASLLRCMRLISWHSNGAINYVQTVRNLLHSNELDNVAKYRLACTYCLEDEIVYRRKILIGHPVVYVDMLYEYFRSSFSLVDYWNCYCADKLYRVPTLAFDDNGIASVDEYMIRRIRDVNNWSSVEYFFDRVSAETQVSRAIDFIDEGNVVIQHMMLLKMNETQRLSIYSERAARIVENYACRGGAYLYDSNAISTWYEARGFITQDQFADLMKRLCKANVSNAVIIEIWISAKVEFKRHILNIDNFDLIGEVLRWSCARRDLGIDFLIAVLEAGNKLAAKPPTKWTLQRKFFFKKLCERLVFKREFDLVARLLDLCVPDANVYAKIKQLLGEKLFTSAEGKKLVLEVEFRKLVQFLKFFYPSKIERSRVLETCKRYINEADFVKLELLLNFFYPPNVPESKQLVRDLLLDSLGCIDLLSCVLYWGENLKELNWPAPLQQSCPEIIVQFKTFLSFSKLSIEKYSNQFRLTPDMLYEIVTRCLPEDKFIAELVRTIVFSDEGVIKLHKVLCDRNVPHEVVRNQISPFFQSNRYKRKLRAKLISCLKSEELRADPKLKENYLQILCACGL